MPLGKIPALIVRTPKAQPGQFQVPPAAAVTASALESAVEGWDEVSRASRWQKMVMWSDFTATAVLNPVPVCRQTACKG